MTQADFRVSGLWHWIESNGLSLLIAIYFGNLACTILLALYTRTLTRRTRHLTQGLGRQAIQIDQLKSLLASLAAGLGAGESEDQGARAAREGVRREIASLMAEFANAESGAANQADVAPDVSQPVHPEPEIHAPQQQCPQRIGAESVELLYKTSGEFMQENS
jgi:hypothetical protein